MKVWLNNHLKSVTFYSLCLCRRQDGFRKPLGCGGDPRGRCLFSVTPHHRDGLSNHRSWEFAFDEQVFASVLVYDVFFFDGFVLSGLALLQS